MSVRVYRIRCVHENAWVFFRAGGVLAFTGRAEIAETWASFEQAATVATRLEVLDGHAYDVVEGCK